MLDIVVEITNQIVSKSHVYQAVVEKTHNVQPDEAVKIITVELEFYQNRLDAYLSDPKNSAATITAVQGANIFLDVMETGLSFSISYNHVYVSRMKGTGTSVGYKITKEGAIYLAQRANAIDHLTEAVIVWKGEPFSISPTPDGHEIANHVQYFEGKPPFKLDNMQVGYVYVIYPNGDRELSRISAERLKQFRAKSQKPENYDDESFIETKIVKHALRSVRKKPFTGQMQLADDEIKTIEIPHTEVASPAIQAPPVINTPIQQQIQAQQFNQPVQQPMYNNAAFQQPMTHEQGAQNLMNSMQQPPQQPVYQQQPAYQQQPIYQPQQQPQQVNEPF